MNSSNVAAFAVTSFNGAVTLNEVSSYRMGSTGPRCAPGATAANAAERASSAAAPRAPPPDGPTQTVTGTVAWVTSCNSAFMSTSTAPDASSWKTTTEEGARSASRTDERMSAALEGSISPLTCTTSMRPALTFCATATAQNEATSNAQPPSPTRSRRHRTSQS